MCCGTWLQEERHRFWKNLNNNLLLLSDSSILLQLVCVLFTRWRSKKEWGCICFLLIARSLHLFFISGNSHQSIAKGGIVNWWLQQYVSSGKANIRCNCLAVSSGLEIASSNRIWAVVLSHIVTRVEGFHQSSPDISPPFLPTPCFLLLLVLSDWPSPHLEFIILCQSLSYQEMWFCPKTCIASSSILQKREIIMVGF